MLILAASFLLSCVSAFDVLDQVVDRVTTHTVGKVVTSLTASPEPRSFPFLMAKNDDADNDDDEAEPEDADDDEAAEREQKSFPRFVYRNDKNGLRMGWLKDDGDALFTEKGKNVPTVDLLHRIASTAGWSMTLVGSPRETVDIDVKNVKPREALRQVLQQSGAMAVLKRDKLVVVASPDSSSAGLLVEETDRRHPAAVIPPVPPVPPVPAVPAVPAVPPMPPMPGSGAGSGHAKNRSRNDIVRFFSDATVQSGQIVQGDVVCIRCDIELEPGAVVRGDTVAVGGSVVVDQGALVLGQAVAVMGEVEVARGAQVMGEHVQVGLGQMFGGHARHSTRSSILGLGPFGLFPTIALFAVVYLLGLLGLRMWPDRVRMVGYQMFENPVKSFFVGFLCWLLLLPLIVLLGISIVGIPLIPLLPVAVFLSIVIGVAALALRIGESLPAGPGQRFVPPAALGMGMITLLLLGLVPWLGISVLAMIQFFALGSAVSSRFGRALPPHAP